MEIGVELRGNLSFPVNVTVGVNFATAIRKKKSSTFLNEYSIIDSSPQLASTILVYQLV